MQGLHNISSRSKYFYLNEYLLIFIPTIIGFNYVSYSCHWQQLFPICLNAIFMVQRGKYEYSHHWALFERTHCIFSSVIFARNLITKLRLFVTTVSVFPNSNALYYTREIRFTKSKVLVAHRYYTKHCRREHKDHRRDTRTSDWHTTQPFFSIRIWPQNRDKKKTKSERL